MRRGVRLHAFGKQSLHWTAPTYASSHQGPDVTPENVVTGAASEIDVVFIKAPFRLHRSNVRASFSF